MPYFVYIMASRPHGALFIDRTTDLRTRVDQHRAGLHPHTARYKIDRLVWFEVHGEATDCLARARRLKGWHRRWKIDLIEAANPEWRDVTWRLARIAVHPPRA